MWADSMTAVILPIAVAVRIVTNPVANLLQKRLTLKGHDPFSINLNTYLILALFSLSAIIGQPQPALGWEFYFYTVLTGITGALGNGYLIRSLRTGDLSLLGPINAWKSVIGLVAAFLIAGELPGRGGVPGIVLIIAGSYHLLGGVKSSLRSRILLEPAIRYRILALILTGIQAVFDKQVILHSNLRLAFASWAVGGSIFAFLLHQVWRSDQSMGDQGQNVREGSIGIDTWAVVGHLTLAASIALMVLATNYTFSRMPVGEALALFQLSILIAVVFGVRFFKEEDLVRKLTGAFIMFAGSALILSVD